MRNKVILFFALILLASAMIHAEQTVKTIEVPLGFVPTLNSNQIYSLDYNIKTPDRIGEIISMEIYLTGDFQASTKIYSRITQPGSTNLFAGFPGDWTSPPISATGYDMAFDFSSLVKQYQWNGGLIKFGIYSDKVALNVRATLKITYLNNPRATAEVHGTEYVTGDPGKVWVQLLNGTADVLNDAICQITIFDPNNNIFLERASMVGTGIEGIYTYDLLIPSEGGVYPVVVECFYDASQTQNFATSNDIITGTNSANTYTKTFVRDAVYHKVKETKIGGLSQYVTVYNFTGVTIPDANVTLGWTILWDGKWTSTLNDDTTMSIYNWTSNTYIDLPNKIISQSGRNTFSNSVNVPNQSLETLGYISPSGVVSIMFRDDISIADSTNTNLQTDLLYFATDEAGIGEWQDVKGSSELHVNSGQKWAYTIDSGEVKNITFVDGFYMNITLGSQSSINESDIEIKIPMYSPFLCSGIESLTVDGINQNWSFGVYDSERCYVEWYQDIQPSTNYEVRIVMHNEWKREVNSLVSDANSFNDYATIACENYRQANNMSVYEVPLLTKSDDLPDDNFYRICNSFYDHYYEFNNTYQTYFNFDVATFGKEDMDKMELRFREMVKDHTNLNELGKVIMLGLGGANDYSIAILNDPYLPTNPNYTKYWANISTSYLNYIKTVNVDINETAIAEGVWGYNGTINSNLLLQFVNAVWSYTETISSNILNAFGLNVWSQSIRNLTWENDTTNYTKIGETVWNYDTREVNVSNVAEITSGVWTETTRTLTSFSNFDVIVNTTVNYSVMSDFVWNTTNRSLTEFTFDVNVNETAIAIEVWTVDDRQLTNFNFETNVSNPEVLSAYLWNYSTRNVNSTNDNTNYSLISQGVWSYVSRTLTSFGFNQDPETLAKYNWNSSTNRNLTWYNMTDTTNYTNIASDVWAYGTRTVNATINETAVAKNVWEYVTRNLTSIEDVTNYSKISSDVWNYSNGRYTHGVIV